MITTDKCSAQHGTAYCGSKEMSRPHIIKHRCATTFSPLSIATATHSTSIETSDVGFKLSKEWHEIRLKSSVVSRKRNWDCTAVAEDVSSRSLLGKAVTAASDSEVI